MSVPSYLRGAQMRNGTLFLVAAIPFVFLVQDAQAQQKIKITAKCVAGDANNQPVISLKARPATVTVKAKDYEHIVWKVDAKGASAATIHVKIRPDDYDQWPYLDVNDNEIPQGSDRDSGDWKQVIQNFQPVVHYFVKVTCTLNGVTATADFDPDVTIDTSGGVGGTPGQPLRIPKASPSKKP